MDVDSNKDRKMVMRGSARPKRLSTVWQKPAPPDAVTFNGRQETENERVVYQWAAASAVHVGTVVHSLLQLIAEEGVEQWGEGSQGGLRKRAEGQLRQLGVAAEIIPLALSRVLDALRLVLEDPQGRFFLANHSLSKSEWELSALLDGERVNVTIDRTFVDDDGVRWIVDWKTSSHGGGNLEGFLDEEVVRYTSQLKRYGSVLKQMESRPQKLVLYFPMHQAVREVS